jgi:signal peptidase I
VLLSNVTFASSVKACKKLKESSHAEFSKTTKQKRKIYCGIKPQIGEVGDVVEIKNQYNYIVALGRVIKQTRTSSIVVLTAYKRGLGSMTGYPVMVRDHDSHDFWTATTSPF